MTEQEAKKLSSHHLRLKSLAEDALQVCYAIEECGASPRLTRAVELASALRSRLENAARTEDENRDG